MKKKEKQDKHQQCTDDFQAMQSSAAGALEHIAFGRYQQALAMLDTVISEANRLKDEITVLRDAKVDDD